MELGTIPCREQHLSARLMEVEELQARLRRKEGASGEAASSLGAGSQRHCSDRCSWSQFVLVISAMLNKSVPASLIWFLNHSSILLYFVQHSLSMLHRIFLTFIAAPIFRSITLKLFTSSYPIYFFLVSLIVHFFHFVAINGNYAGTSSCWWAGTIA